MHNGAGPTRPLLRGLHGSVAASHPLAVGTGLALLRAGGNAADAAIGAAAVLGVVLPHACGLGGDALLLVRDGDGQAVAFNGTGAAPSAFQLPVARHGAGSATVPGCVDAWERVHERYARLALCDVLADAIALARDGFPVGDALAATLQVTDAGLARDAATWPLRGARAGQVVRQPVLADALERIGRDGARAFYEGELAERLIADHRAAGGGLAPADLARHGTAVLPPLASTYHGLRVIVQPPVSQAALAIGALRRLDDAAAPDEGDRVLDAVRALAAVFAHKHELALPGGVERLLEAAVGADPVVTMERGPRGGTHTAAVAVADGDGLVISQLVSIFDPFGSRVLVGSGGYLLGNRLADTATDPASANAPAPGRRPMHTLSPAILDDGAHVVAVATPGADGQVQILVQLVQALADLGLSLPAALERPRWRLADGVVALEHGTPPAVREQLERSGVATAGHRWGHPLFGAAVAAGLDRREGCVVAASDPRREAWAGVW